MNILVSLGLSVVVLFASPSKSNAWPMVMQTPPENQAYFKVEFFNGNVNPQVSQPQPINYPVMPYSSPFYANIPYPRYHPQPFYHHPIPVAPYSYNSNPFSSFMHNHQTPRFVIPQPQAPRPNQSMKNMAPQSSQGPKNPAESDNLYDIIQNRMLNKEEPKMTWHKILQMINEQKRGLDNPSMMDVHVVPLMAFNPPVNQAPATTKRPATPPQPRAKSQPQAQAPPPAPPMPPQNKVQPQNVAKPQEQPSKPDFMTFKNIKFDNPRAILENMGFRVFEIPPFNFNSNKQTPVKDENKEKLQFRSAEIENNDAVNTKNEKENNEEGNNNNKINNIPNEEKLETRSIKMDSLKINTHLDSDSDEEESGRKNIKMLSNDEENSRMLILPNYMSM